MKSTNRSYLLEDLSSGLMSKLIKEHELEDGISELVMILCKGSSL